MKGATLASLLHAFFHQWLGAQRNLSQNSIASYRDAWRLFLKFVSKRHSKEVIDLSMSDVTADAVLAFLDDIENQRKDCIGTRNCRLSALKAFAKFVSDREPLMYTQLEAILRIPTKRGVHRQVEFLESEEVTAILNQPDRSKLEGQRDHALFFFLYNTGARIQEALDVTWSSLRLSHPYQVRLLGKGRKERVCPLWDETVEVLRSLAKRCPRPAEEPLFVNRYGQPLTAAGVRYKLATYVRCAATNLPALKAKRVTPHTFRHTAGVHLVSAGVDVTVIRNWLGHVSLDTTNIYARADLQTKRDALSRMDPRNRPSEVPRWKKQAGLLEWLDAL